MTTRMTSTHCTSTIAWRFTTWTPTSTSTESAHECAHCHTSSLIIHTHMAQAESCTFHPISIPSMCALVVSLWLDLLHSLLLSLPPVCHLLPPQRRANKKFMENLHNSANNGCEDTYDFLYLPTGCEPKAHDFDELQNSSVHPLLQDPYRGPGRG